MMWTCSECGEGFWVPNFAHVPGCMKCGGVLCGKCYCGTCKKNERKQRATELEFLKWMWLDSDFGPADSDVKDNMAHRFMEETGKNIPEGWNYESDGEIMDKE